ncbi:dynamin family protein [Fictibacillus fluitans]|uniref:Dynamin family protein n=1 Tax=Fictibacillus fluitans TaxID=3058422 RepID=A0ABT8HR59_9BACL|nr:dynamin family protein [Fictibacillus sp. NE201]MDN4523253.1 dynamin family protein [Fictibacillus sp. NE201]
MNRARMTETKDKTINPTAVSIAAVYREMKGLDAQQEARAVLELYDKVKNQQFAIAFCGHFSAGKSSMINELIGKNILPSSPIPTSANVVKVQSGSPSARVKVRDKGIIHIDAPVNLEKIKKWAKNGHEIESIEINVEQDLLPDRIAIYDTPGIDSTDDAHKVATESALHMADVVFYIMDYNHVLSQLNFTFIRLLKEQGKKVYLIVNQIDKHNEKELAFSAFAEKVKNGFKSWDIESEDIFFTTIMEKEHPGNQLREIKTLFQRFYLAKDEWVEENARKETERLISTAVQNGLDLDEEHHQEAFELAGQQDEESVKALAEKLSGEMERAEQQKKENQNGITKEFKDILDNAILMPFQTRDLAKNYIESRQDSFKVGLLFAGKKTDAERKGRLNAFHESVKENVKTQISWHLKDFFQSHGVSVKSEPVIGEDSLAALIKPGASLNGNYVLQYCNDVVAEIKKQYTSHFRDELNRLADEASEASNQELRKLRTELNTQEKILKAHKEKREILGKWNEISEELKGSLNKPANSANAVEEAEEDLIQSIEMVSMDELPENTDVKETVEEVDSSVGTGKEEAKAEENELLKEAEQLQKAANVLSKLYLMKNRASDMNQFAEKMKNRDFTVSLFGAFSAGKSSFANALIGEDLLPVSPNPTTATINRIAPPNGEYLHGTARIHFKKEEDLLAEINQSLVHFGKQAGTMEEAVSITKMMDGSRHSDELRPHLQFLLAVSSGFDAVSNLLGKEQTVSVEQFKSFVADEEKACFTESVTVYYDCPLTSMGVTLVDTPGADSINARHTNVAFEFIKKSDAILYVTYYNHAFSAADREFLIQLGRVKDTFELDKMFFVINASDLAKDDEELQDVVGHVGDNLRQFGIRKPKLFPMSSYFSLLGQKEPSAWHSGEAERLKKKYGSLVDQQDHLLKATGYTRFMEAFTGFLNHDLAHVMVTAAKKQLSQASSVLDRFIAEAISNQENAEQKKEELQRTLSGLQEKINDYSLVQKQDALEKEIQELLYYVKQRVMLRFTEFFNEAFNPAVISGSVKEQKNALPKSGKELHQTIQFDLQQESRATVLRVERVIVGLMSELNEELDRKLAEWDPPQYEMQKERVQFETLVVETELRQVQGSESVYKEFKNAKQFFEQGGKKKAMNQMYDLFEGPVTRFTEDSADVFSRYYQPLLEEGAQKEMEFRIKEYIDYYEGLLQTLNSPFVVEEMKKTREALKQLV